MARKFTEISQNEALLVAEESLLDSRLRCGERQSLQRRIIRLSKPPRRWKVPVFPDLTLKTAKVTAIFLKIDISRKSLLKEFCLILKLESRANL